MTGDNRWTRAARAKTGLRTIRVVGQVIPPEFAEEMVEEWGWANKSYVNALIVALRRKGWTYTAMANVVGVSVEALRLRAAQASEVMVRTRLADTVLPEPPVWEDPVPKEMPKIKWAIPAEIAYELRALTDISRSVNGATPASDPRRQASVDLAGLIASLVDQGWGIHPIANACGVSQAAIRMRLSRHGFRPLYPSCKDTVYKGYSAHELPPRENQ